ncbi:MAG: hypothetical protein COT34_00020 [Candidatus Nealsonbacteria bacterium CG08_land_8_20_14_0_20_43_11]|uniref:Uncharacterized protein n=1 Tax=Candidatus Nealsonbacteria bacterium CG08_land_8_20_14_0_20_43_11 TaxID=1974706 RepID=A0A2M6T1B3_9BACT|nr:MAG: hypothetical protein COT34_00020 [Candidatus Nealsonbacteria bacterium CG08_land_8_20_14_0_20_43_11]
MGHRPILLRPVTILPLNYFRSAAAKQTHPFMGEALRPYSGCGYSPLALRYYFQEQNCNRALPF